MRPGARMMAIVPECLEDLGVRAGERRVERPGHLAEHQVQGLAHTELGGVLLRRQGLQQQMLLEEQQLEAVLLCQQLVVLGHEVVEPCAQVAQHLGHEGLVSEGHQELHQEAREGQRGGDGQGGGHNAPVAPGGELLKQQL